MITHMNFHPLLLLLPAVLLLWLTILTFLIIKQRQFFQTFTQGVAKNDLKTVLKNIATSMKKIGDELNRQNTDLKTIHEENLHHFQKIGFVRYNPFSDTGGDQSFCLCLLDQHDRGFVITSLHSREQTRIYAKAITNGQAKGYELSKEEVQAVSLAKNRNQN